jgi:hypothetical protein
MRPDTWELFRPIVLEGLPEDSLAHLEAAQVLLTQSPPSYGHDTRLSAAKSYLTGRDALSPYAREQIRRLVLGCARQVTALDTKAVPFIEAIFSAANYRDALIDETTRALITSFLLLMDLEGRRGAVSQSGREQVCRAVRLARGDPSLVPAVAVTLYAAITRSHGQESDFWLRELRELSLAHLEIPAVRRLHVGALFHVAEQADIAGARAHFAEVETLLSAGKWDEESITSVIADAVNWRKRAKGEKRDLLDRLTQLLFQHSKEFSKIVTAVAEGIKRAYEDPEKGAFFMDLARKDYEANPDSIVPRHVLVDWLHNVALKAPAAKARPFLEDLRALGEAHPDDEYVRDRLAIVLVHAFSWPDADTTALVAALRCMHQANAGHALAAKGYAIGLALTAEKASDALLNENFQELGRLRDKNAEDADIRAQYVSALREKLRRAAASADDEGMGWCCDEIERLHSRHPDDAGVIPLWNAVQAAIASTKDGGGTAAP